MKASSGGGHGACGPLRDEAGQKSNAAQPQKGVDNE